MNQKIINFWKERKKMNKKEDNKMVVTIPVGLFAVIEEEDGEKKQVDMRKIVGSKEKDKEKRYSNVK